MGNDFACYEEKCEEKSVDINTPVKMRMIRKEEQESEKSESGNSGRKTEN